MDYKATVHLPRTDFPMKANLAEREPAQIARWAADDVYGALMAKGAAKPRFVLHDGPPYANGHLHQGHFLNKILKDIVVKYRNMAGQLCDFVPGWDCHGLPIELQVDKALGSKKREMSAAEFRRACRAYAAEQVDVQREEFRRLGALARWSDPYLTMAYGYEAQTVRELAAFVRAGAMYRRKRPVHWCPRDATALAEAEVEYESHKSPSIYVAFKVVEGGAALAAKAGGRDAYVAIWTTTPWTIPANLAVAVNPDVTYALVPLDEKRAVVIAKDLLPKFFENCARTPTAALAEIPGAALAGIKYLHPLYDRVSPVLPAGHVTTTDGTGLVHTAPGHGEDDYWLGLQNGLDIFAPLDNRGRFTDEVPDLVGKSTDEANKLVPERLNEVGALLNPIGQTIEHQYPHCWRCHHPVLFRATDQWFLSLEKNDLRARALAAIDDVRWIPKWGRERIRGMMETRPDWCISRQRQWGVPIPVLYCDGCNEPIISADAMEHVASMFEMGGADVWYERTAAELLAPGTSCAKCNGDAFRKEKDILDVWFDSGVSSACVLAKRDNLGLPADLYLEGSDQHRGWFNSSLLAGLGARGAAPYKAVLTHGFVVDGSGKKMSKSLGNYVAPELMIKKYGAEVVRLWVASSDYRDDIRLSPTILDMLAEGYRKIRNTLRYCLSNLDGFDPAQGVASAELLPLDRWVVGRLARFERTVQAAYETYEFHTLYHATIDFCATDLSATYFDILKDRLYCDAVRSRARRSAQTVLFAIADRLCRWLAPVMSFTTEEAFAYLPGKHAASVFLEGLPEPLPPGDTTDAQLDIRFAKLFEDRARVNKALEDHRNAQRELSEEQRIGNNLDARVVMAPNGTTPEEMAELLLVSQVEFQAGAEVKIELARGARCVRCRRFREGEVGAQPGHPELCKRCGEAIVMDGG